MDLIYILFSLIIFTYPLFQEQFLDTLNATNTPRINSSTANTSCSVFPRSRPVVINAFVSFMMVMLSAVKVTAIMNSIGTQSIQP